MGSGAEIARDSADVELISSDLNDLAQTFMLARRARRIVVFNVAGTIIVDLIGIALADMGVLSSVVAAFIHVGSEPAFILNSALDSGERIDVEAWWLLAAPDNHTHSDEVTQERQ